VATRVVVTDHVFGDLDITRSVLEPLHVEITVAPAADESTLARFAEEADALMVCYAKITAPVVDAAAAGGCRVIARSGIGYDNIDVEAATRHGILVTYVPDYCLDEVADHTLALLLSAVRVIPSACLIVRSGRWSLPRTNIHRLQGCRLALLGFGRIGRKVAERARAFGMQVIVYDPFLPEGSLDGVERAKGLEQAVAGADFISLHAPMTPENYHLIDDAAITLMRRSPLIVNTARGGLLDLDAVTRALDDGRLSGVALDVTEIEPLPADHPLRGHPRALVTPHMGYYSVEAQEELERRTADEIARALRGEPPRCPINPEVLAATARTDG